MKILKPYERGSLALESSFSSPDIEIWFQYPVAASGAKKLIVKVVFTNGQYRG